ncbi:MAG: alpha-ketoglutarate-dependent dioxygenase AlkB [Rhodospirillaceae bacterium]|nr:alpha-ketoglutarate-dependent dioxygenase AlkB [Rhodospirillaceae bacterium]
MSGQTIFNFMDPPDGHTKPAAEQIPLSQDTSAALPRWLGLETSHRRLFDASQDGWLRPPSGSCFVLGEESFVSEEYSGGPNLIPVRLAFDVDKLAFPDARKGLELIVAGNEDGDEPRVVPWCAPIPLYAVRAVEVPSSEMKTHLLAMAGQFSNVSLPDTTIATTGFAREHRPAGDYTFPETQPLELPESLNAIQGAMMMAIWAVPRVGPWIEVLRKALGGDAAGVAERIGKLDAQWLEHPWLFEHVTGSARDATDDQGRLWRAALRCMRWPTAGNDAPGALAEKIAEAACGNDTNRTVDTWLDRTLRIIAADETIVCAGWRQNAAGLAIQLALLRPDPVRFKSWNRDMSGVPPGVWWAAATLCGWRHGYRDLDKEFRGDANLQEFVAICALEASRPGSDLEALLPSQQTPLEHAHEDGCFTLTLRGQPVIRKPWKSRAKWYASDLTDNAAGEAALTLASRLEWPCIERRLFLPEGRVDTLGGGRSSVDGDALVIEGEKSLRLPKDVSVKEQIDLEEFRIRLATEAGDLPDPPESSPHRPKIDANLGSDLPKTLADRSENVPPGLIYRPEFITEEEELRLMDYIDRGEWSTELRRRVQHYGWRYDYKKRRIDASMKLGELPEWAMEMARRLVGESLMNELPDQLIVNEYIEKQGIAPHIDAPDSFTGEIATVSLLETWGMVFRCRSSKEKVEKRLERRSVAVLTGDARYLWEHEIPKRDNEPSMNRQGKRKWTKRSRRISLTFRKTRLH